MSDTEEQIKKENTALEKPAAEGKEEEVETTTEIDAKKNDESLGGVPALSPVKDLKPAFDDDKEDTPPAPPRPARKPTAPVKLSAVDATIAELVEMFPETDLKYVKMALIASEGRLEPASNALLFLSDPDSGIEIPTPKPARQHSTTQLEKDEELARRLAKSYEGRSKKLPPKPQHGKEVPPPKSNVLPFGYADSDDDDILENINKTVTEAKVTIGSWFGNVAKKIQDSIDQPDTQQQQQQEYQRRPSKNPYQQPQHIHKSGYYTQNEYVDTRLDDADDDDAPKLPSRKPRSQLFPALGATTTMTTHKDVNLQGKIQLDDNTVDDVNKPKPIAKDDLYSSTPINPTTVKTTPAAPTTSSSTVNATPTKSSDLNDNNTEKNWTPLKSVDPEPSSDAFLVDDSEDEDDDKDKVKDKDNK